MRPIGGQCGQGAPERDHLGDSPVIGKLSNIPAFGQQPPIRADHGDCETYLTVMRIEPAGNDRTVAWLLPMKASHFAGYCFSPAKPITRADDFCIVREALLKEYRAPRGIRPRDNEARFCSISLAARLEQEPGTPLGLVYPDFDQARGGDVTVLVADVVGLAQARGKRLVVLAQFGEHVLRLDILGIVVEYALVA